MMKYRYKIKPLAHFNLASFLLIMISQFAVEKFVNKGIERTNMSDNKKDKQATVLKNECSIAITMSVDEYFDELISQVHEDYAHC